MMWNVFVVVVVVSMNVFSFTSRCDAFAFHEYMRSEIVSKLKVSSMFF